MFKNTKSLKHIMKYFEQDFDFIFKFRIPLPEFASEVDQNSRRNMEQQLDTVPLYGDA
jgi:hypothetical protein